MAKTSCLSPGEAPEMSPMVHATAFQILSDIMGSAWALDIVADVSTNDFGSSHLDVRTLFPLLKGI